MPIGRMVGVERVKIQAIARDDTTANPRAGEPYARVARVGPSYDFARAQYAETEANRRRATMLGAEVDVSATLTLWADDVAAAGYQPSAGDRLIEVADADGNNARASNLYVVAVRRTGKLIRFGRQTVILDLADRAPARPSPEGI